MAMQADALVAAFYRFAPLAGLDALRADLLTLAGAQTVRGTILLAAEGVNGTICGSDQGVQAVLARLRAVAGLERLTAKFSRADGQAGNWRKLSVPGSIAPANVPIATS